MKKIEIFEPAMCCSTGVCGPNINTELLRITTVFKTLAQKGINIVRYNLNSDTEEFVANATINEQLTKEGADILPITLVDGVIAKTRTYPTNEEFSEWTGIAIEPAANKKPGSGCCGGSGSCC